MRGMAGVAVGWLLFAGGLSAASAGDAGVDFFEKKIRPVLVQHCYSCHSVDAKKVGGKLLLDSRVGVRNGGELGPVVEPGKPDDSLLIQAVRYSDESLKMPPQGKLPAAVISDLEQWVKLGAPDPREQTGKITHPATLSWEQTFQNRSQWWSLKPVKQAALPTPKNGAWSTHPVDLVILNKLESRGLSPATPASPATLIRRLSFVLTGLPPSSAQVEAFLQKCSSAGYRSGERVPEGVVAELVDRLLASPHFGERWGRHWLDVVRFTETHGNEWNYEVHHAWRYRDYVIRAFNEDLPYDRFVREHVAGDLLPPRWNPTERFNESPIGTSFFRFGEVNHDDCISLRQIGYDLADNQIDTLTKAFQATTVACARCHDHKLDAISTRDYYGLFGILASSRLASQTLDAPEANLTQVQKLRQLKREIQQELAALWTKDVEELPKYLLAADALRRKLPNAEKLAAGLDAERLKNWTGVLSAEKTPLEDLLEPWRQMTASDSKSADEFAKAWNKLQEKYRTEEQARIRSNAEKFVTWADFRRGPVAGWEAGGLALRRNELDAGATRGIAGSGELVLQATGPAIVRGVLPAGCYTHGVSEKLNGILRSPVLPGGKKWISFQVVGQRSSALRLVSNNCQLNYRNYKSLISPDFKWITFEIPEDRESLRTYAELMTMFDNPKFPDQLSALGGDKENYKLPWDKAAENPRSYFGITRVVLHDEKPAPQPELRELRPLWTGGAPRSLEEVAERYRGLLLASLRAWEERHATDDDANLLDTLIKRGLVSKSGQTGSRLEDLVRQYRQVEHEIKPPTVVAGLTEGGAGYDQAVLLRGDCLRMGEKVPRRYLDVLAQPGKPFIARGSGRLELAERIAGRDNPLTARVMVNRIWHHLFGAGIVRTTDDFGHVGDPPSHQELLDDLAFRFMNDGWSTKRLIRHVVLSRTFQAGSQPAEVLRDVDPANRLLQHYPARRLEAEGIRDSILATSGRLDQRMFGQSVQPFRESSNADRRLFAGPLDGDGRRTIYIKNNLMEPPKFLGVFNMPGGKVTQGQRDLTNVPAQALALLNDPFVLQQAEYWAERLVTREQDSIAKRIESMFRTALGRKPTVEELGQFEAAATQLAELHEVSKKDVLKSRPVWKDVAHAFFNLKEFIYIP